jgi:CBS domain containing-hemolysin-like protein
MFEFGETKAGEIMTPRTEIVALPIDATVRAARDLIIEENFRACRFIGKRLTTSKALFTSATC